MKESYPVQVAEYAKHNKIVSEPAFAWWVPAVLRRRDRIIKKVKAGYLRKTHKYGIEVPNTVAEAIQLDLDTGTTYWQKAIEKEMKNVRIAFEFNDANEILIAHKKIPGRLIFDVKMLLLVQKARYVAGGHKTDPLEESVYSSIVSFDSVRIGFLLAAIKDGDIPVADIQNVHLEAPTKEKVSIVTRP